MENFMDKLENLTKDEILKKIGNGEIKSVFMKDDFYECVIKITREKDYLKHKNRKEVETSFKNDTVYDIFLSGVFITEEEYSNY